MNQVKSLVLTTVLAASLISTPSFVYADTNIVDSAAETKITYTVEDVAKKVDSLVLIEIKDKSNNVIATGSGFIISSDGKIITNYHVIEDAYSADITLENGTKYAVQGVLGYSKEKDIAVIKLKDTSDLPVVQLGDSSALKLGQSVVAIGSPNGYQNTVSTGIISGLNRVSTIRDGKDIQITASITNGSSGGALFNMKGEVVGITYSGYDEGDLNFAIPVSDVQSLLSVETLLPMDQLYGANHVVKYFPLLSDVPCPENASYYDSKLFENEKYVYYLFNMNDLPLDFFSKYRDVLAENGWSYWKSSAQSDGTEILYFEKDYELFGITSTDTDIVLYGSIR